MYVHARPECLKAAGKGGLARSLKRGVSRPELDAIAREKSLKAWKRAWKVRLIEEANPDWRDLFDLIA